MAKKESNKIGREHRQAQKLAPEDVAQVAQKSDAHNRAGTHDERVALRIKCRGPRGFYRCRMFFPPDQAVDLDPAALDEPTKQRLLTEPMLQCEFLTVTE